MKPLILLISVGTLISIIYLLGKMIPPQVTPLTLLAWQIYGSAAIMLTLSLFIRSLRPELDFIHVRYYLISGVLGLTLPNFLVFQVLNTLDVGLVSLVTASSSLMTYSIAVVIGMESHHARRLFGVVLGFCGVLLVFVQHRTGSESLAVSPVILLAMGIPLSLATGNIYRSRAWPAGSSAPSLVLGMLLTQAVLIFPLLVLQNDADNLLHSFQHYNLLLLLGPLAAAGYAASFVLQRMTGPVYMSQLGYVITASGLLLGIFVLHESYAIYTWVALALIFMGLLFTNSYSVMHKQLSTRH